MSKEVKGSYTLKVPKGGNPDEFFEIQLKDIDEPLYLATLKMIQANKEMEAVRFMVKNLWIGGDSAEEFCSDWRAVLSANTALIPLMQPLEGELKKN